MGAFIPGILYEDQAQIEATLHVRRPPYLFPANIISSFVNIIVDIIFQTVATYSKSVFVVP